MNLLKSTCVWVVVIAGLGIAQQSDAATAMIAASKGNTLYQSDDGSLSNGRGQYFFCGVTDHGQKRRGLIAFDIAANVPAGSVIQSASLKLHMSRTMTGPVTLSLHRSTSDFGEGTSVPPVRGSEGGGTLATPGDATWLHSFYNTRFWTTPGGDYLGTPSSSVAVAGPNFYTWPSTATSISDVQGWLDSPSTNFGWTLVADDESSRNAKGFDSRWNDNPAFRPVLELVFAPPSSDPGTPGGTPDAGVPDPSGGDAGVGSAPPPGGGQTLQTDSRSGHGCSSVPGPTMELLGLLLLGILRRRVRARPSL